MNFKLAENRIEIFLEQVPFRITDFKRVGICIYLD